MAQQAKTLHSSFISPRREQYRTTVQLIKVANRQRVHSSQLSKATTHIIDIYVDDRGGVLFSVHMKSID